MCTLIAFWRAVPGFDIALGMNRDESRTRPSDPPDIVDRDPLIVAPRDRQAGGTWIGANGLGMVAALSNRRGRASTGARSRGLLVLDVLRQKGVAAADVLLRRTVREHEYNFWNLLVASRNELRFFHYDGDISMARGREGLNVLTNDGGNVPSDPKARVVRELLPEPVVRPVDEAVRSLQTALRTHASGPDGIGLCVHGAGGGTVSSTILAVSNVDPDENILLYADGPPCSTPYRDFRNLARQLRDAI